MALKTGDKLSESLSEYIYFYTETKDLKDSAEECDCSVELLRAILRQERSITESNKPLIYSILRKAIHKRTVSLPKLNSTNRAVKKILEQNNIPTT